MQHPMSTVALTLFGAFQALREGSAVTRFRGDKVRALLVYLAIEADRPHTRAHLAGLLWPEHGDDAALDNVSKALTRLRAALGDAEGTSGLLRSTRQTIAWNSESGAQVDVTTFMRLARSTDPEVLEQAVALYRGPLVPGFSVPGCAAFDEWLMLTRERCERLALAALERLATTYLATGAFAAAEGAARRVLAIDPWRETAYRYLMHALAGMGDRAAALAAYERCRQVLHDDLHIEPDEETRALLAQIRAGASGIAAPRGAVGDTSQAPRSATPPGTTLLVAPAADAAVTDRMAIAHDWSEAPDTGVLYGRAADAAQLGQWLLHERCRLVAVLGMGGVGKTALAAMVARSMAGSFDRVIWRSLLNAPPFEEWLRPVLHALAPHTPAALPADLDAQLALLLDALRRQRCLLILDNFESLLQGEGSGQLRPTYDGYAHLLDRLAHSNHNSCLVLTSRERPQGMARWEAELRGVRALRLQGLDAAAGQAILAAGGLAGQEADGRALAERYSGNPLALKLVAQTVHELFGGEIAGLLREETPIFDDIRAVLDQQWERLSALEQALLMWLAIEREPTAVAVLRSNLLQPVAAGMLVEALRALQRRSLLERGADGVTLQNVVIEYLTERLVAGVYAELLDADLATSHPGDREQGTLADSLSMLNRFALVKAQAKQYVRQTQVRMLLQPLWERLRAVRGTAELAARVQAILVGLRATAPLAPGYAGGNLLNLLLHGGISVAGYDFSRLSVWQADVQGVVAAGLNFGDADLTGSAFTLTLSPYAVMLGAADDVVIAGPDRGDLCVWRAAHGQVRHAFRTPSSDTYRLVFSPDGQLLAGCCQDRTVRLWSVTTGATLQILEGHTAAAEAVAVSHDARLVASGGADHTIRLWEAHSGQCLAILRQPTGRRVHGLAFRPTPTGGDPAAWPLLASGGDELTICLWDTVRRHVTDVLHGHEREIECLAFSSDGTLLASGSHDGMILLWDVDTAGRGRLRGTLQGHRQTIRDLAFHPTRLLLASASADGTIRLWEIRSGRALQIMTGRGSEITHVAFSSDGRALASGSVDREVRQWEVETGRTLDSFTAYLTAVHSVRFRPDGRQLASGSADGRIHLWDSGQGRIERTVQGHAGQVLSMAYSPDGRLLASGSTDATIRLWDLALGRSIRVLHGHQGAVTSLAMSADGRLLASAGVDRTIRLWSVSQGAVAAVERHGRVLQGHADVVESVAFSPDGRMLVSSSQDHTARLWSVERGQVIHVLSGHTAPVCAAVFSQAGDRMATISYDDTIRLWEVATGRECAGWSGCSASGRALAFSPRGDLLAHGSDVVALAIRDVSTGAVILRLYGHTDTALGLDWSPSEPILASSAWDGTVRLWNVDTGACVQILQPPGPYAGMNITGVTGISEAQRAALKTLGAVDGKNVHYGAVQ